mgnify:CR=1 FL=1
MNTTILYSFLFSLLFFMTIGLLAALKRQKNAEDYLLASRDISPFFAGVSAAASTASGFGFTGVIGFGYMMGLGGSWFVIGIVIGGLFSTLLICRRFRVYSERYRTASYTEYLMAGFRGPRRGIPQTLGFIALVAMVLYAAAQLTAGSKALHVLFNWDYNAGAILGSMIVILYCFAGGIRASIWTDVIQFCVMIGAMFLLLGVALSHIGGLAGLYSKLEAIDPQLVQFWPDFKEFGAIPFILGWVALGVSFIGFPHVMSRIKTVRSSKEAIKTTYWYYTTYATFYVTAYIVALTTRVLLPESADFDAELALPQMALEYLAPVLVGLILAGIFASTISTADSLILACTATISRDFVPSQKNSYRFLKATTVAVTFVSLIIAIFGSKSVFDVVLIAISIMGATFSPLVILRSFNAQLSRPQILCMVITGLLTVVIWRQIGWSAHVYEALPGFIMAFAAYGIWFTGRRFVLVQNQAPHH